MASERDDRFLTRWAQRKQRAVHNPAARRAAPAPAEPGETDRAEAEAKRQELIDSLPEPERLGPDDDYAQFLEDGVPDDLRQRALRRLWGSNPVFANLDGLNDYDLDYTDAATVVENLKSAFQAGRGMVTRQEREAEAETAARAARGEPELDPAEPAPATQDAAAAPATETQPGDRDGTDGDGDDTAPAHAGRARYRASPDRRRRVKGAAARRRWGG